MARTRAFRREQSKKSKERARALGRRWFGHDPDEKWVCRMAATHCRPCSCYACRWPKGRPTRQELSSQSSLEEQADELYWDGLERAYTMNRARTRVRALREALEEAERDLIQLQSARWPSYPW